MASSAAIGSALAGIAVHRTQFDAAAGAAATVGLPDTGEAAPVPLPPGSGELVDVMVGSSFAARGIELNAAVLQGALEAERSVLDVRA